MQLDLESVDLVDVVEEATSRLGIELGHSGSSLAIRAPKRVVGQWDRSRMDQVVTNLVSNAVKFGMGRPIEVEIAAQRGWTTLTVRDHGMGMDEPTRQRVFRPFERGVSLRHYGGLGLGLYIVKTIVEAQGGFVDVQSQLGAGSTFTVRLPQFRVEGDQHAHPGRG
jgi:signal transduction histidine kinase